MKYLPLMLDLTKTRIIIFGGGKVALRKIEYLQGADVTVVSENFDDEILRKNVKAIRKRIIDENDVKELIRASDLVIIATSNKMVNEMILHVCEDERRFYNLVDDRKSKIIFPSFYEENGILLAISTSGRAPSLSTFIRKKLSIQIKEYAMAIDIVEKIRKSLDSHNEEIRKKFFETLFSKDEFWSLIKKGNMENAYDFAMRLWRNMYVPD
ncbi:MAG: precorrin-2 dehydrogenase/sirohydrochlorin ferrochelatase family protein [Thermoplasmata archaeon]